MRDKNIASMKYLRKTLRNNGTPAEGKLWSILKNKQVENLTFRRQFSIGKYILDFYCPTLRLAIELDGMAITNGSVRNLIMNVTTPSRNKV